MANFRGFNTVDTINAPYTLSGDELVKRDLKNEFYTKQQSTDNILDISYAIY